MLRGQGCLPRPRSHPRSLFVGSVATYAPYRVGGVEDYASLAQAFHGLLYVYFAIHRFLCYKVLNPPEGGIGFLFIIVFIVILVFRFPFSVHLELRGEMESEVLEVLLCHAQHIAAVCQEHVASVAVLGHVLVLAFLEVLQFRLVTGFAGNPACLVQVYGLPAALGSVFVLQAVLNNLEPISPTLCA